jgi:hypothetical protein
MRAEKISTSIPKWRPVWPRCWLKLHNSYSSKTRQKPHSKLRNRPQQDPIVQMQQQELAIKQAEQQRKAMKDQVDAQLKAKQQQIEAGRIMSQMEMERQKLAADKQMEAIRVAAEMRDGREKDVMKIGVDLMKQMSSQAHQKEIQQGKKPTKGE